MNIRKLREAADFVFEQKRYDEAFYIYDAIYKNVWTAIGTTHSALSGFSQNYLNSSFKASYEFKNMFVPQAVESVCKKWFDMDTDQTLNELAFTTYGHLQCISYSPELSITIPSDEVYNEFLVLHTLVLEMGSDSWINSLLKIVTPVVENNKLIKLRPNLKIDKVKQNIIENSARIKDTDWYNVNLFMLDYLFNIGDNSSELFTSVNDIVGFYFRQRTHRKSSRKEERTYTQYEKYEKYEKYERFEKYERRTSSDTDDFDATKATDFEKAKYYGKLLGLSGKVTKSYIRKRYLDLISKYHPDRVSDLGDELKALAEKKTKQINAAYEWFKQKYKL
jgi:hypothetical protein